MFYIFTSIDVEGVHGPNAPFEMIDGNINGYSDNWGVFKLIEIFKHFCVPATFFVDIYEKSFWGEDYMRNLCNKIKYSDFDLQLHTHPGWRIDKRDTKSIQILKKNNSFLHYTKDFMSKLSFDEQCSILRYGRNKIFEWIGEYPLAHRSGGYSINKNTYKALQKEGFKIDSSMNAANSNTKYLLTNNAITISDDIIQLPVTTLNYKFDLINRSIYSKRLHTDIVSMSCEELVHYVDSSIKKGLNFLNLFMHSYSLLNYSYRWNKFSPSFDVYNNLNKFLKIMSERDDVAFVDCKDIAKIYNTNAYNLISKEHIPDFTNNKKIIKLAIKKLYHKTIDLFL